MALWIEYRTCFGGVQMREVCGGDFVIVSEDLCDEFEAFKKRYTPMWTKHTALSKQ